jgi:perosamine synthetase
LFVPLSGTDITDLEINCVLDVLNSGRLALGPYLDKFETIVKDYVNSTYSVAVNSGTSALHLILRSLGFKSGDKMIVTRLLLFLLLTSHFLKMVNPFL